MESSKSIFSLPPNDRDCLSPLLSMYDPSSVLCVYSFPFCFSCLPNTVANSSLPNQIWVVVARDGSSPVPPIVSTSFSHDSFFSHNSAHSSLCPSPAMAMLSVLRALDERDSTPTVVLYCDVMQMASVTDTSTSQEVTLSMASASTSSLPPLSFPHAASSHASSAPLLLHSQRPIPTPPQVRLLSVCHV